MSSIHIIQYLLWEKIKQKGIVKAHEADYKYIKTEEIVYPNEMICRVCTNPGDIPVTDKIDSFNILFAIRTVANIAIFHTDSYPKYICTTCYEELKIALTFKRKCESSDYVFRQNDDSVSVRNNTLPIAIHDFELILNEMKRRRLSLYEAGNTELNVQEIKKKPKATQVIQKIKGQSLKYYKCIRCDLKFDTKKLLEEHRILRNCVCPPCPLCGKLVSNLARHKKIVHLRSEKYTCHFCGKISYSSGALRSHLLVHSDKFKYLCPLCPYKGKQQAYLTLHMRVHTGERPYLCSECPSKFVNPSNLRKHQLVHSKKKFECNRCKKQFRLQKTLQEHYDAAHLNVRYRCSICSRDLWTRRKLLSHELRVHKREKHKLYDEVYKVVINDETD